MEVCATVVLFLSEVGELCATVVLLLNEVGELCATVVLLPCRSLASLEPFRKMAMADLRSW